MKVVCTFALLVAALAASTSSESAAQAWLQSHKQPSQGDLGQLQQENPAAFALVNALLAKRSQHTSSLSPEERNGDIFRKMMTPRHLSAAPEHKVALPYETASVQSAVVDQGSYNPNAAVDRDESSVDKLLEAVAGMGGDKGKKIALLREHRMKKQHKVENTLLKDANLFGEESPPPPAPVQAVAVPQPEVVAPAPKHGNSYLAGLDLSGDMPVAVGAGPHKHKSEGADLSSFSFDDSEAPAATVAPKKVIAPTPKPNNAFLNWLSGTKKAAPPQEEAPAKPVKKENSYIAEFMK